MLLNSNIIIALKHCSIQQELTSADQVSTQTISEVMENTVSVFLKTNDMTCYKKK